MRGDTVVYKDGETEEASEAHERARHELLLRCREKGLKLNTKTFKFKLSSVKYVGHILRSDGLAPDPSKVQAICDRIVS